MLLLVGINILWVPLSMIFNSLQSIILPVAVLSFVPASQKGTTLGLLLFAGLAASACTFPLAGYFSDQLRSNVHTRWGSRTTIILLGAGVTLLFLAVFAFANSLAWLAIAYVGVCIAAAVTQAGTQGLLPDLISRARHGSAAGLKGLLELSGSVLGFAVAGVMIKRGNVAGALVALMVTLVAGILLMLTLVREHKAIRSTGSAGLDDAVLTSGALSRSAQESAPLAASENEPPSFATTHMTRARVLVSRLLFLLGIYGVGHFLLYYLRDHLHLTNSATAASAVFTVLTIVTALVALPGGMLSDRFGRYPMHIVAGAFSVVGVLLLIPASTLSFVLLAGALMSVGSGLFASANWALAADIAPQNRGGFFFGVLALATSGAGALAGLLGPLVDHGGYAGLFGFAALAVAVSVAVMPRPRRRSVPVTVAS